MGVTKNKFSISLAPALAEFARHYQQNHNITSRFEVVRIALDLLRKKDLETQYVQAFIEWEKSGELGMREALIGNGIER